MTKKNTSCFQQSLDLRIANKQTLVFHPCRNVDFWLKWPSQTKRTVMCPKKRTSSRGQQLRITCRQWLYMRTPGIPSLIEPAFPRCMSCQFEWPPFWEQKAGIEKGSSGDLLEYLFNYLALGRWVICLKIVPSETKKILCGTPLLSKWTS